MIRKGKDVGKLFKDFNWSSIGSIDRDVQIEVYYKLIRFQPGFSLKQWVRHNLYEISK